MRVAVVILTWNGRQDTLACLASVSGLEWSDLDVIVADNGSVDGTLDVVASDHPDVHVVRNDRNLGFAEGNNRGIAAAFERGADAVLILNNDAEVPPDLLQVLVEALEPDVGAISPVVRADDGRLWFAGSRYDPARLCAGRASDWERGTPLPTGVVDVDRAVGAAMLVPRAAVEAVGVFDAELFYLFEDVEWSLRLRRAGFRILLDPRVAVLHRVAASQGGHARTPLTLYYGVRNDLEVRRRSGHGGLFVEVACVAIHVAAALRWGRRPLSCAAAAVAGWRDFRRGRLGPRPISRSGPRSSGT